MKSYYVYILTNKYNNVLYVGFTGNLMNRILQHKNKVNKESFTSKYSINKLVYYEIFSNPKEAILRESNLKNWHRSWKYDLIANTNPNFEDLFIH